jgi:hypothetical protein
MTPPSARVMHTSRRPIARLAMPHHALATSACSARAPYAGAARRASTVSLGRSAVARTDRARRRSRDTRGRSRSRSCEVYAVARRAVVACCATAPARCMQTSPRSLVGRCLAPARQRSSSSSLMVPARATRGDHVPAAGGSGGRRARCQRRRGRAHAARAPDRAGHERAVARGSRRRSAPRSAGQRLRVPARS